MPDKINIYPQESYDNAAKQLDAAIKSDDNTSWLRPLKKGFLKLRKHYIRDYMKRSKEYNSGNSDFKPAPDSWRLDPVELTKNWYRKPEFKNLHLSSEDFRLVNRYVNNDLLSEKEEGQLNKILDRARIQRNDNIDERTRQIESLKRRGLTQSEAEKRTLNLIEAEDNITNRVLDKVNFEMTKFKDSDWAKTKLGKVVSDFHTNHGDAATLGAGAAALGLTALAGYGLYKGAKKLFGKKKEQPKRNLGVVPGQPAYNTMPLGTRRDQMSNSLSFPTIERKYNLPPEYASITQKDVSDYLAYLKTQQPRALPAY